MNNISIFGKIASEPKFGTTKNGKAFAKFDIKWIYKRPTKSDTDRPKVEFLPVEVYGKEQIHDYLVKDKPIAVTGRIRTSTFTGSDGKKKYTKVLIADRIDLEYVVSCGMSSGIIAGNLAGDCQMTYIKTGEEPRAVAEFTVCVDRGWKEGSETDFFPVKIYGKGAEALSRNLTKGRRVAIKGRIDTGSYKAQDGATVKTWCIIPSEDRDSIVFRDDPKSRAENPKPEEAEIAAQPVQTEMSDLSNTGFEEIPEEFDMEYFDD